MASLLLKWWKDSSGASDSLAITIPDPDDDKPGVPDNYYSVDKYSAAVLFEVFLYGVYSTLFAICIRVLVRNRKTTQKLLLACAVMMFALATVDVILEISFLFWFVIRTNTVPDADIHFKFLIYITSNIIADALVIYRCHSIWGTKRVILLPTFLLICGSACGYAFIAVSAQEYRFRELLVAFLFTTVTLNMLVTVLMAGRIWWIARKAREILGPRLSSKYNTMIAILVESGVIYSIYVILDVVFPDLILDAGLAQVVGIVPTLIIVQIGLGRDTHDVDTSTSIVRTDGRGGFTTTLDSAEYGFEDEGHHGYMTETSQTGRTGQDMHYRSSLVSGPTTTIPTSTTPPGLPGLSARTSSRDVRSLHSRSPPPPPTQRSSSRSPPPSFSPPPPPPPAATLQSNSPHVLTPSIPPLTISDPKATNRFSEPRLRKPGLEGEGYGDRKQKEGHGDEDDEDDYP